MLVVTLFGITITHGQITPCNEAYSCLNKTLHYPDPYNETVHIYGYKSVSNPNVSIIGYYSSNGKSGYDITIHSAFGVYGMKYFTSRYIACYGDHSCANVLTNITASASEDNVRTIDCRGMASCMGTKLLDTGRLIDCRAERACSDSILQAKDHISGGGAYSLMNSIIYPFEGKATVYLRGYYSGYNATLICEPNGEITCSVNCAGNGCKGFIFQCKSENGVDCYVNGCDESAGVNCPIMTDNSNYTNAIRSTNRRRGDMCNTINTNIESNYNCKQKFFKLHNSNPKPRY